MKKVLVNETFYNEKDLHISMYDRGYQFGDGVYEVIRFYHKKFFKLEEHLLRYYESARKIDIDIVLDLVEMKRLFEELLEQSSIEDGYVYTQITRGIAPRNHVYEKEELKPHLIAYVEKAERPIELMKNGAIGLLHKDERWTKCDVKSLNLLGSILAKNKAKKEGAFEAILYRGNYITEGSVTNVFVVRNNILYTPPANNLILNGITRLAVIDIANELGIQVVETAFLVDFLLSSDEVFTTATVSEITPIIEIIGRGVIGNGEPGVVTKRIQEKFTEVINEL